MGISTAPRMNCLISLSSPGGNLIPNEFMPWENAVKTTESCSDNAACVSRARRGDNNSPVSKRAIKVKRKHSKNDPLRVTPNNGIWKIQKNKIMEVQKLQKQTMFAMFLEIERKLKRFMIFYKKMPIFESFETLGFCMFFVCLRID